MRVQSMASGSSGNALLIETESCKLLFDCGIPVRTLTQRLRSIGISPSQLNAVFLTHEHHDHVQGLVPLMNACKTPVGGNLHTLHAAIDREILLNHEVISIPLHQTVTFSGCKISTFASSHDAANPCGYLIEADGWRVCYAVDSGRVTESMQAALIKAHLLVVEANHDVQRLVRGPYPQILKQRILSPTGHLSNEQTADAIIRAAADTPKWVWLAHLSKTNNTPELATTHIHTRLNEKNISNMTIAALPRGIGPVWDSGSLLREVSLWDNFEEATVTVEAKVE